MTVILITENISENVFWKKDNFYVIQGLIKVLTGVKIVIESGTNLGFLLNPNEPFFNSSLTFLSGSELEAGCLFVYPVDQNYKKTTYSLNTRTLTDTPNFDLFRFNGSTKVEPQSQKTKIVIKKLICNNVGGLITFDTILNDEVEIKEINCNNSYLNIIKSSIRIPKIKITNSETGIKSTGSNIIFCEANIENVNRGLDIGSDVVICNKLFIRKANFAIRHGVSKVYVNKEIILGAYNLFDSNTSTPSDVLIIKQYAKLFINGILNNNIQIETIDPFIPNERPYSVPYKAVSCKILFDIIFKLNPLVPPVPSVIPEKEGYKIITGDIVEDTVWVSNIKYVIQGSVNILGKLIIEDNTNVLFFPSSVISLRPTSQLLAGEIISYPVTYNLSRVCRYTLSGWRFLGANNPVNFSFKKLNIDSLYSNRFFNIVSNLGTIGDLILTNSYFDWFGNLTVDNVFSESSNFSLAGNNNIGSLSVRNTAVVNVNGFNVKILEIKNVGYGLNFKLSQEVNIFNKFEVIANDGLFNKRKLDTIKILTNKGSRVNLNGILLDIYNIITDDTRIPQTKPYSVPYVAQVNELTGDLLIN